MKAAQPSKLVIALNILIFLVCTAGCLYLIAYWPTKIFMKRTDTTPGNILIASACLILLLFMIIFFVFEIKKQYKLLHFSIKTIEQGVQIQLENKVLIIGQNELLGFLNGPNSVILVWQSDDDTFLMSIKNEYFNKDTVSKFVNHLRGFQCSENSDEIKKIVNPKRLLKKEPFAIVKV